MIANQIRRAATRAGGGITSPLDLTNGVAWYDFLDFSTMFQDEGRSVQVTTIGQNVANITDQIGGYNANISTGFAPQVSAAGVLFNGSSNRLIIPESIKSAMYVAGNDLNVFAISTPTGTPLGPHSIIGNAYFTLGGFNLRTSGTNIQGYIGNGVTSSNAICAGCVSAGVKLLSELAFDNSSDLLSTIANNGTPNTAAATFDAQSGANDGVAIGAIVNTSLAPAHYFGGDIIEIVITGDLLDGERTALMQYFQNKHGLGLGV